MELKSMGIGDPDNPESAAENIALLKKDFAAKWKDFSMALGSLSLRLPHDETLGGSIETVFSLSDFVARTCIRDPGMLVDLAQKGDLFTCYGPGRFENILQAHLAGSTDEAGLKHRLGLCRRREMVRIAWRDLAGWADLDETVTDLSGFADACVGQTLDFLFGRQCRVYGTPLNHRGEPQQLVVLGMGKLGTRELNFSSDIDLVFAYPENGKTSDSHHAVSNEEFFLSLGRKLINVLGASSEEGNLFRVDMRLRPYGENGPLALSFDAMEDYYQSRGREWERYAWLRARIITGDGRVEENLLRRLSPFVYRRYLDYTVFESLREMKHKIAREVQRRDMADNVKLGPGGIREIEFFCQTFQVLRGGVDQDLRECDTRTLLRILAQKNIIIPKTEEDLKEAYEFLRRTEHHLQEMKDIQTHSIPLDSVDRLRLGVSMGFSDYAPFKKVLDRWRAVVHGHFNQLLESEGKSETAPGTESRLGDLWQNLLEPKEAEHALAETGYLDAEKVLSVLKYLREAPETRALSQKGRKRVDLLMPRLLKEVGASPQSDRILSRIVDLIKAVERRTNYIALLLENPAALSHLIQLADKSPWIITFLARHPVLLDELLDHRTLYSPPGKSELTTEIQGRLNRLSADDLEYQIEALCIFKQVNTLRVAAADVTDALYIMKVSDHLTYIAETVLENVMDLAWDFMVKKHGAPVCLPDNHPCGNGFLIVGYGKVGGIELGYHSDLDLVFLHAGSSEKTTGGRQSIDTPYFYARLGQRIVHLLTARTRAGMLYETDMRLRPSGASGPLVSQIEAFFEYQMKESWVWEKQALVRARPLCGDPALIDRFWDIRETVLTQPRQEEPLRQEVGSMREKLRKERLKSAPSLFDVKEDEGGIVDIEFLVQYLVLLKSHQYPELTRWTDNVRILETLLESRIIDHQTAALLKQAYLAFRTAVHRLNLQEKPAVVPVQEFEELKAGVMDIWKNLIG